MKYKKLTIQQKKSEQQDSEADSFGVFGVRAWPCSPKFRFSLTRKTELWRTNKPPALRVVRIASAL